MDEYASWSMGKMGKRYLVDSENVGDVWVPLLVASQPEDEIIVFYTQKSPYMNYENVRMLKETEREAVFVKCYEGNNALDFQLVTELGYLLHGDPEGEFVIVTNDTGFDAAVRYWVARGMNVRRLSGKDCHKMLVADKKQQRNYAESSDRQAIEGAVGDVAGEVAVVEVATDSKARTGEIATAAATTGSEQAAGVPAASDEAAAIVATPGSEDAAVAATSSGESRIGDVAAIAAASGEFASKATAGDAYAADADGALNSAGPSGTVMPAESAMADGIQSLADPGDAEQVPLAGEAPVAQAGAESGARGAEAKPESGAEPEQLAFNVFDGEEQLGAAAAYQPVTAACNYPDAAAAGYLGAAAAYQPVVAACNHPDAASYDQSDALANGQSGILSDGHVAEGQDAESLTDEQERRDGIIRQLFCCISRENLVDFHNALVIFFGEEEGKRLYQTVKGSAEYAQQWASAPEKGQEEKFAIYCDLVFAHSEWSGEKPADMADFLYHANGKRKNLNSLRAALQGHYGKDMGMKYYSLFKTHIKIMNRM